MVREKWLAERRKPRVGGSAYFRRWLNRDAKCCDCEGKLMTPGICSDGRPGAPLGRPVSRPTTGPRLLAVRLEELLYVVNTGPDGCGVVLFNMYDASLPVAGHFGQDLPRGSSVPRMAVPEYTGTAARGSQEATKRPFGPSYAHYL
jgi:hypothetical protein